MSECWFKIFINIILSFFSSKTHMSLKNFVSSYLSIQYFEIKLSSWFTFRSCFFKSVIFNHIMHELIISRSISTIDSRYITLILTKTFNCFCAYMSCLKTWMRTIFTPFCFWSITQIFYGGSLICK